MLFAQDRFKPIRKNPMALRVGMPIPTRNL